MPIRIQSDNAVTILKTQITISEENYFEPEYDYYIDRCGITDMDPSITCGSTTNPCGNLHKVLDKSNKAFIEPINGIDDYEWGEAFIYISSVSSVFSYNYTVKDCIFLVIGHEATTLTFNNINILSTLDWFPSVQWCIDNNIYNVNVSNNNQNIETPKTIFHVFPSDETWPCSPDFDNNYNCSNLQNYQAFTEVIDQFYPKLILNNIIFDLNPTIPYFLTYVYIFYIFVMCLITCF